MSRSHAVSRPGVRGSASAFDAARSGSWHYYRPVSIKPIAPPNTQSAPQLPLASIASVERLESSAQLPTQQVFDAANPATWNRQGRVLYTAPGIENTNRINGSQEPTASSASNRDPSQPRTLEQWSGYLASAGISGRERTELLADIWSNLRQASSEGVHRSTAALRTPTLHGSHPSADGPRSRTSVIAAFSLDDPDFGDTSAYWNSVSQNAVTVRGPAALWSSRAMTRSTSAPSSSISPSVRPTLPRQPTHLNYSGIAPEVATVRRRASLASVTSCSSRCTLPEYSPHATNGSHALPHYSTRDSLDAGIRA